MQVSYLAMQVKVLRMQVKVLRMQVKVLRMQVSCLAMQVNLQGVFRGRGGGTKNLLEVFFRKIKQTI